jgi:hypothetical protein
MPKREVRRLLIVYEALGPMVAGGLVFLVIAFLLSMFFSGIRATRIRGLGFIVLGVLTIVGLFRTAMVVWKTRNLE